MSGRLRAIATAACALAAVAAVPAQTLRHASMVGPIDLELYTDGSEPFLILRVPVPVDAATSAGALDALFAQLPEATRSAPRVSLFAGRIIEHPWLSEGLAAAALGSPHWDAARGAGRDGDNRAVSRILETKSLFAPWNDVFARHGFAIRHPSVEKVLKGRVGKTTELAALAGDANAAGKALPFDAMLYLRLERRPTGD